MRFPHIFLHCKFKCLNYLKGGENVDIEELRSVLFAFIKRAASEEATSEEVASLREVARVLLETFID